MSEKDLNLGWPDLLVRKMNELPIPLWLLYLLFILTIGLINNMLFWQEGIRPFGEFDFEASTDGVWPAFFFGYMMMLVNKGKEAMRQYRPLIAGGEKSYDSWKQQFTVISRQTGRYALLFGFLVAVLSWGQPFSDSMPSSIIDFFARLYFAVFSLITMSAFFAVFVFILRQIRIIGDLHQKAEGVDLFDLEPTHAFSKLTAGAGIGLMLIASFGVVQVWRNPANTFFFLLDGAMMVLGVLAFFLPLRGMRKKLLVVKAEEMRRANQRLKDVYANLNAQVVSQKYSDVGTLNTTIDALTKERNEIASISTLPWDTSTFRGFVGSILLPIFLFVVTQFLGGFF